MIPLENLTLTIDGTVYNRPRIDVFATIVSNNPGWISLLTSAVSMVNDLNESVNVNFVKKHYNETGSLERLYGLPGAVLEGMCSKIVPAVQGENWKWLYAGIMVAPMNAIKDSIVIVVVLLLYKRLHILINRIGSQTVKQEPKEEVTNE